MNAVDPTYRLPAQELRQLEILEWIAAAAGQRPHVEVTLSSLFEDQPTDEYRSWLHDELEASGLIGNLLTPNNFGGYYCQLTPAGADRTESILQLRADVLRRRRAARDVALRQLYDVKTGLRLLLRCSTANRSVAMSSRWHCRGSAAGISLQASSPPAAQSSVPKFQSLVRTGRGRETFEGSASESALPSIADAIWRNP